MRIKIPPLILKEIENRIEFKRSEFSYENLRDELKEYIRTTLNNSKNADLYQRFSSYHGLGAKTFQRAWNQKIGAEDDLRNLICYYRFGISWSETLKKLGIDEAILIEQTNKNSEKGERKNTDIKKNNEYNTKEIETVRKEYFKYLENECGKIRFEGLSEEVNLEDAFVPVKLVPLALFTSYSNEKHYLLGNFEDFDVTELSIDKILLKEKWIAIVADPGAWKNNTY